LQKLVAEGAAYGLSPASIIEVDRDSGCFIASTGAGLPEAGYAFLYHDNAHHFYFYAEQRWHEEVYDVFVSDLSASRFRGDLPDISAIAADLPTIRRNAERFFRARRFFPSEQARPPGEVFRSLVFDIPSYLGRFG
jgi:hypothetical protein